MLSSAKLYVDYKESADYILKHLPFIPKIAVIIGSGLDTFCQTVEKQTVIPYREIPHFPVSTIIEGGGELICGESEGVPVLVMRGRFHCFEGYSMSDTSYPVGVFKLLGIEKLIITNASGTLNAKYNPGDLVCVTDQIMLGCDSPATDENTDLLGERFFDMQSAYSPSLIEKAHNCAKWCGFDIKEGIYFYISGPQYITRAEANTIRLLGADLVGSSTVGEVVAAAKFGLPVLCVSCCTYRAPGLTSEPVKREEILEVSRTSRRRFINLVSEAIKIL